MAMKDVREQLSELVKRATYRGEQITFGPNRGDDVTLIATEQVRRMAARLREVEERLTELLREKAEPGAFSGLQDALVSGELAVRGADAHARRVLPEFATESAVTREARIRLGARDARVPEFRRTRPRA
ncbi:MAG TPA: hypothetical protein VF647_20030 [Longimicrobium sp.]